MSSAPWRIALASAVGTSHESTGAPCQDSSALTEIEGRDGPVLIAAVSDGAGSAAHSELGSALAVRTFVELVQLFFAQGRGLPDIDHVVACGWVRETADTVTSAAHASGHQPRDYSCTLLAAIVGPNHAAFTQVGDGAIVVSHGDEDGWAYVFWPQHGEYANTTNFIQSPDIDGVVAFDLAPRCITEFAIFSDGIENLVLHKAERSVHQGFFRDMIQPVRRSLVTGLDEALSDGLRRYLASRTICERTDDDKTLLLATRVLAESPNQ
jgi:hypothetical protein